ncbi:hypothetical protein AMELA_G00229130 [Ameiurus melas]|uniref:Uncharacterized protein n=1 Tax=Ameiurus melas TaxID=219545 RepID=A0A7J6A0E1_AMEME|nr:hypothetical protein AMELA_G00229130 [Ameiurus melas]
MWLRKAHLTSRSAVSEAEIEFLPIEAEEQRTTKSIDTSTEEGECPRKQDYVSSGTSDEHPKKGPSQDVLCEKEKKTLAPRHDSWNTAGERNLRDDNAPRLPIIPAPSVDVHISEPRHDTAQLFPHDILI